MLTKSGILTKLTDVYRLLRYQLYGGVVYCVFVTIEMTEGGIAVACCGQWPAWPDQEDETVVVADIIIVPWQSLQPVFGEE